MKAVREYGKANYDVAWPSDSLKLLERGMQFHARGHCGRGHAHYKRSTRWRWRGCWRRWGKRIKTSRLLPVGISDHVVAREGVVLAQNLCRIAISTSCSRKEQERRRNRRRYRRDTLVLALVVPLPLH